MPIAVGIDLGTTTVTALALDTDSGDVLAVYSLTSDAERTSTADKAKGRSEWDAERIVGLGCDCLRAVTERIVARRGEFAALGVTGQQHGVLLVDGDLRSLTPLMNWQDQRTQEAVPGSGGETYLELAVRLLGKDAVRRTGCRLASGYMGTTLFWLERNRMLPAEGRALFLADFFAARLTGARPVTDATNAAGSGLLNLAARDWDAAAIEALAIPPRLLPRVAEAGDPLGTLRAALEDSTGLPAGLPVTVALGDHQASVVGSVAERKRSILVNVGTGGQVAGYTDECLTAAALETRPFPRGGYLLVSAGLCGGRSYAVLERFFRTAGEQLFGTAAGAPLYARMNQLAASAPPGADGLRCEPLFSGTRADPSLRARWTGASPLNFTPAHMARSLLEGMARVFRRGLDAIRSASGQSRERLVGAGNGLRENPVLAACVAEEFGMPLLLPQHREEAAFGAALMAAVGAGIFPDVASAGSLIRYAD